MYARIKIYSNIIKKVKKIKYWFIAQKTVAIKASKLYSIKIITRPSHENRSFGQKGGFEK